MLFRLGKVRLPDKKPESITIRKSVYVTVLRHSLKSLLTDLFFIVYQPIVGYLKPKHNLYC